MFQRRICKISHHPTNLWCLSKTLIRTGEFKLMRSRDSMKWTHLWYVFLTHGNALKIETATAMLVSTPIISTAS